MKKIKLIISHILIASLLVSISGCGLSAKKKKPFNLKDGTNYTIMIYMVGSNLESEGAAASRDILEMADSGIDLKHNNVIIYAGGSKIWHLDNMMSTRGNLVQLTTVDGDPALKQISDSAELPFGTTKNMGEQETLTSFVDYCYDNFKAKNYALILWNHGGGPIGGFGSDELYEGDPLFKIEMGDALKNTKFVQEKKFDFVGFDACLMSSIEFARTLSDYADYMVASQETEPGFGWDYSFMQMFNKTDDPVQISKKIIKTYEAYYDSVGQELNNPDLTLSILNLKKTKQIVSKMNKLFEKMSIDISEDTFSEFARGRDNTKSFALSSTGKGNSYDVVDLGDFMDNVPDKYSETAMDINDSLNDVVVSKYSNIPQSSGVSFYYPYDNRQRYENMGKYLYGIDGCDNYRNFIEYFTKFWSSSTSADTDIFEGSTWDKAGNKEDQIKFHFDAKELKRIKKISYTILRSRDLEKKEWEPICENIDVKADNNGDVFVNSSPKMFYLKGTNGESVPWHVTQLSSNKNETVWMLNDTELQDYLNYHGIDNYYSDVPVNVTFAEKNNGSLEIKDILKATNDGSSGRENIDISKYSGIKFSTRELIESNNKKGMTKPYSEWKLSGIGTYGNCSVGIGPQNEGKEPFEIEKKEIVNDLEFVDDYAIQLVAEDFSGNKRASKIRSLNKKPIYTKETETIDNVNYTYKKYANKSILIGIKTEEVEVNIPKKLGGQPVTEIRYEITDLTPDHCRKVTIPKGVTKIGEDAFENWYKLEDVIIPDTVKSIDEGAFENCKYLRKIKLPDSLEYLGHGVFKDTNVKKIKIPENLKHIKDGAFSNVVEEIELDDENDYYTIVDDALFTADEKTLVYYPHKPIEYNNKTQVKTIDLIIPDGCEHIGSEAIGCEQISNIEFPSTLKEIGPAAFSSCGFIKKLDFPSSLKSIGSGAFLNAIGGEVEIHIGKNISYVGPAAFKGNYISRFTVSINNKNYSQLDGNVTNKSRDTLIFSKTKNGKEFKVPNGIVALASSAMDGLFKKYTNTDDAKSVVIPDSVVSIDSSVDDVGCNKWTIGKGLRYWGDVDYKINTEGKYNTWGDKEYIISKDNPYYYVDGKYIKKKKNKETDKMSPKAISEKYKK